MSIDKEKQNLKIYFPGLNGLRFIAAFLVIIHHTEQFKTVLRFSNYWENPFIRNIGGLGVNLFFVLSGFLITYLLLSEKENFNTISIKNFYIRRMLRIWPLYFLIAIAGLYIIPHFSFFNLPEWTEKISEHLAIKSILFFLILPNLAIVLFTPVPYAAQTWSIGVEEQFYLIWPLIIKYTKRYLLVLVSIVFITILMNTTFILLSLYLKKTNADELLQTRVVYIIQYLNYLRISCMAIGGIGAYLLFFNKEKALSILYSKLMQVAAVALIVMLMLKGVKFLYISQEIYALLFAVIILNIASNPQSMLKLNNQSFDFLGKISYGLYMYHPIAIVIAIKTLSLVFTDFNTIGANFCVHAVSLLIAIAIATLSYYLLERKFLKFKKVFTKIESGK